MLLYLIYCIFIILVILIEILKCIQNCIKDNTEHYHYYN